MNELPEQKNADWDVELIQDKAFGEAHLEAFADAIGGEGKYVVYVGGLTVTLHNLWADYAVALQKQKYPKMQQIGDRFGVSNSVDDSYKTAIDQMQAHPDLKGFLIFGANGPIGAGQAVADQEKIGKVIVVGPFIPSRGLKLMKEGAITRGYLWNPIDSGYALVALRKTSRDRRDQRRHGAAGRGSCPGQYRQARYPRQHANRPQSPNHRQVGQDHLTL